MSPTSEPSPHAQEEVREAGPPDRSAPKANDALFRTILCIFLFALPAILVMNPVTDFDVWWQMRTGQWIVEHGTWPTTDPFSEHGQEKPWIAYSWLFGVLLYALHQQFGLTGILIYRIGMAFAITAAIHHLVARRERRFVVAIGWTALAVFAISALFSERSWLVSILFYALTLDVVLALRAGSRSRAVWLLPVGYAVWANVHIQFANGLFMLGLACAAPVIDRLLGRGVPDATAHTFGSSGWRQLVLITAACTLATLLTPYHVRVYGVIRALPMMFGAFRIIGELQSMQFRAQWEWAVLILAGLATFRLGRRPRLDPFEVLLLASSVLFSFRSQRDAWCVVLAALAILTEQPTEAAEHHATVPWGRALTVAATSIGLVLLVRARLHLTEVDLQKAVASLYPAQAVAEIRGKAYPGPLYNHYNWGGYLIWNLPERPVAIDGRADVYGVPEIERSLATWSAKPGWETDPALARARLIIAALDSPLTSLLRLDPRFERVYADEVCEVFVVRSKPSREQR